VSDAAAERAAERRLPPISQLCVGSLACAVVGTILVAARMPRDVSLLPSVLVLALGAALLVGSIVLLARISPFAWGVFRRVAGWSLVGYLVIAGMVEYAFVYDSTPGRVLAVLSGTLALFAVDVPLLLGFSVARYQLPGETAR
jgi:hypothetical protein